MSQIKKLLAQFIFRVCLFALAILSLIFLGGCTQKETPGRAFLTEFYTSNQGGRYDAFQAAWEAGVPSTDSYQNSFANLCSERGFLSLMLNRTPVQYDDLAAQYGCQFTPQEMTVSSIDEGGYATFSVLVLVTAEKEERGAVTQTGSLTLVESNGVLLVESLWVDNMDDLYDFLKEQ